MQECVSPQEANFSEDIRSLSEDIRIRRIAERAIAREMEFVGEELELLRSDLHRSYEIQRIELQAFYRDAIVSISKGELD